MNQDIEYDYFKKEIQQCQEVIHNVTKILYISLTAILAWAINSQKASLCLAPYCMIIPIYIISLDYNISMLKIGAYLSIFHQNFEWEKRLHVINCKKIINRYDQSYKTPYIFSSIMCTILFFLFFKYEKIGFLEISQIVLCLSLFIGFNVFIKKQKTNDEIKQIYIENWGKIKQEENI